MTLTPIIDMFSGTGELARAVAAGLEEPARPVSFSDNYGPARKYLRKRFLGAQTAHDFREQIVPEGSIVTIGAPCQDLSVAGKHAGADRDSGTRSSLIHEAFDMAVAGGADLIVAARRHFEVHHVRIVRHVEPQHMAPTPTASSSTGPGRSGRRGGANLQTWIHEGNSLHPLRRALWTHNAAYVEWLMGLPSDNAAGLSRTARIRLAGNDTKGTI